MDTWGLIAAGRRLPSECYLFLLTTLVFLLLIVWFFSLWAQVSDVYLVRKRKSGVVFFILWTFIWLSVAFSITGTFHGWWLAAADPFLNGALPPPWEAGTRWCMIIRAVIPVKRRHFYVLFVHLFRYHKARDHEALQASLGYEACHNLDTMVHYYKLCACVVAEW